MSWADDEDGTATADNSMMTDDVAEYVGVGSDSIHVSFDAIDVESCRGDSNDELLPTMSEWHLTMMRVVYRRCLTTTLEQYQRLLLILPHFQEHPLVHCLWQLQLRLSLLMQWMLKHIEVTPMMILL
mmetsp:Transcript_13013/g.26377  ORF Transcript_13013/g.26377 Transcript_13013/m.26377 type:complete len:127 (+) Transcript_13013:184-564(+)